MFTMDIYEGPEIINIINDKAFTIKMEEPVKYVLTSKIKKEKLDDDEEDTVACRICAKTFVTETALNNHARMEHTELYSSGNPEVWTEWLPENKPTPPIKIRKVKQSNMDTEKMIKIKTEELVSSMEPTSLTTLASEDVSYIIIKADPSELKNSPSAKKKKVEKDKVVIRKEVQPISGPFECLQPSNIVPDKTCHQIFFSCCEYSVHFRDDHTRRRKGLRCQVCEKPLANPNCEDGLPYSCDLCGASFSRSDQLEAHISVNHVKHKPYECSVCGKRFTQKVTSKGGVQQHMRMHTGDKPYACTFCPKSFTQKSGLGQHLRIHTKVKPYRCVICSKAFCQSVHLKQHMRTHTNVSPFQCGICQKRFKQSSHLNYHLKYHDPATLTEEQKQKYSELIGIIGSHLNREENEQEMLEECSEEVNETTVAVQSLENQEVLVVSEVYEPEYILGNEQEWNDQSEHSN